MPFLIPLLLAWLPGNDAEPGDRACVVVVVGASGTSEYQTEFTRWAGLWTAAADKAKAEKVTIGLEAPSSGSPTDRERLQSFLAERAAKLTGPLWLVLIGHGTFDGREAKFNLRGSDVTDAELAEWINPFTGTVAIIDCTSASAPFLPRLSGKDHIIVSATRSGDEQNFARFGQFMAESIADNRSDLDKDGQVSLLEAFLMASGRVAEFYRSHGRLATEHALIDDNGDRVGTPPDWFQGVRVTKHAKDNTKPDGTRAHQLCLILSDRERRMPPEARARRDELERAVVELRAQKSKIDENEYYAKLETIMVELAKLYQKAIPEAEGLTH